MGISLREYARRRGVSHVAVMKAIKVGRITPEPDGSLDPAKVDTQWDDQTDPARRSEAPEDEPAQADETPAASDPGKPGDEVAQVRPPAAAEPAPQGAATFIEGQVHDLAADIVGDAVPDPAGTTGTVFKAGFAEGPVAIVPPVECGRRNAQLVQGAPDRQVGAFDQADDLQLL